MVNGNSTSENIPPNITMPSAGKQQGKNLVTGNKSDGSRKQGSTTNDGSQRRAPPQKAWTSGMNPITQRSTTPSQQNGVTSQNKSSARMDNQDSSSGGKFAYERLLCLFANFMGLSASVTVSNGDVYSGIFFGASMDKEECKYLLKMVQQTRHGNKTEMNGVRDTMSEYIGVGDDHAMSFNARDVVDLAVEGATIATQEKRSNGATTGFRTDGDISGNKIGQERELQPWVPPPDADLDQSLESSGSTGTWDQFEANENLFGVRSDYDENIYTTRINKSHPNYHQREVAAMRMAQRMGESPANNVNEGEDWDEEDRYSGVRREATDYPPLQSTQPNRYQPPARRPPTGKPTVPGAPVDPAIISSQIARPEVEVNNQKESVLESITNQNAVKTSSESAEAKASQVNGKDDVVNIPPSVQDDQPPEPVRTTAPSAAKNVEHKVLSSFKQFSEKEKIRVADDRRQRVVHDKTVKLNDLRGFSKNFKLNTPVPSDLVPILAKDKKKQDEILEKALRNAEQQAASPVKSFPKPGDQVPSKPLPDSKREVPKAPSSSERQDHTRQGLPPRGPQASLPFRERQGQPQYQIQNIPPNDQGLSHRLAKTQRDRQAGIVVTVPAPLPIHTSQKPPSRSNTNAARVSSSQTSSTMRTPTSATSGKFNVKAMEFVPNPAANTFMPTGQTSTASSPKPNLKPRTASRASSPSEFFGTKKPLPPSERPSILESFNPLKRLKEKAEKDGKVKDYASNGGIAFAHATSVTWTTIKDGEEGKSYKDMFEGVVASTGPSPRPSTASPMNPNLAHQHQLPAHLQHGSHTTPTVQTQPHPMYQGPPPQHLYPGVPPQIDDQRMHPSPSISTYSTPRMQNSYNAYPVPMGQPMPPMPGAFPYPSTLGPGHPQMMPPAGPQPPHFRQYAGVPQYMPGPGQQLAAPMMMQQNSQGPYMTPQGGHVPVYASGVLPSYVQSQPPSGYPSPSRGAAPMMVQQGSYQGQIPQMNGGQQYGQPFYSPQPPPPHMAQMRGYSSPQPQYGHSPSQQYHYPHQHRMPSHSYGHHSQGPTQMPMQQHAPPVASVEGGEPLK
ncbi:MAG: hypothetical protein Q9164_003131 [Protoblastenia rupestris]